MFSHATVQPTSEIIHHLQNLDFKKARISDILEHYKLKVGFEIHAQMNSRRKLFSNSLATQLAEANTHANMVDLAFPGMLPVLNEECLDIAIRMSLALNGHIPPFIKFDRKHYFYADLPQGYQITQKDHPIMSEGQLNFFNRFSEQQTLAIERIQIEQDSAKSFHDDVDFSYIDYNRAGMPLLEIVTYPEIDHPEDGKLAIKELQDTLKQLNISDANMEEGQMRCDVNVSLQGRSGSRVGGARVEVKNVLGIRFIEKAIEYEVRRHAELLSNGMPIKKETRRYDAIADRTISLRSKEEDIDYRFLVDPDLPKIYVTKERIEKNRQLLKPLPFDRKREVCEKYQLPVVDVRNVFNQSDETIQIFEDLVNYDPHTHVCQREPKQVYQYIYNTVYGNAVKKELDLAQLLNINFKKGQVLAMIIDLTETPGEKKLSPMNAKDLIYNIIDGKYPLSMSFDDIIKEEFGDISSADSLDYESLVESVLSSNQKAIDKINKKRKSGKGKKGDGSGPIMFLVGQVMQLTKKQGDPKLIEQIVREKLDLKE